MNLEKFIEEMKKLGGQVKTEKGTIKIDLRGLSDKNTKTYREWKKEQKEVLKC